MLYQADGVVIRTTDYGEGNKILTVFTKTHGKVSIMSRGAKKPKSRNAAVSQLFTYADFHYFKSGQMGTLNQAELIKSYRALREQLALSAYAAYLAELTDRVLEDRDASGYLFDQLIACYDALEDGKHPQIVTHLYELKMMQQGGYAPGLENCMSCGSQEQLQAFSASAGGAICRSCMRSCTDAIALHPKSIKLLYMLQRMDGRRLGKTEVSPEIMAEMKQALRAFIDTHVGLRFKSRSFLDQMEKYGF
ncbi:DNA repair protein RecO [Xylanibacillus composti]|uniref:DNA repair protein RecO n=1 Tax=Xylanibacillus composti TaxID=1572762 RepID=A0A8J4M0P1_9BACL|nr:DNA repair protein RecO [Xylanibacillus composti]MDT9724414.1 DNA repair protein RecO [Xylanibacillus composti]GIQ68010.1 DNA repair protein RecO [Xylanibacillus composti]